MIYSCDDSNDLLHAFLTLTCPSAYYMLYRNMSIYCNTWGAIYRYGKIQYRPSSSAWRQGLIWTWIYWVSEQQEELRHQVAYHTYLDSRGIHTKRWTSSWLNNTQNFAFLYWDLLPFVDYVMLMWGKIPGSPHFSYCKRQYLEGTEECVNTGLDWNGIHRDYIRTVYWQISRVGYCFATTAAGTSGGVATDEWYKYTVCNMFITQLP